MSLPDDVELRVHDSNADMRYLVLPERPANTDHMSEEALAELVTRKADRRSLIRSGHSGTDHSIISSAATRRVETGFRVPIDTCN
jgi:hypothetical protein